MLNFTFLIFELILADQLRDLPPIESSSGEEWQFCISTFRANTRTTGRSTHTVESSHGQFYFSNF